jgi:uncharacterized protein (DUF305 family)
VNITWLRMLIVMVVLALGLVACSGATPQTVPQTGSDVDALFINMMAPHHQGAVEMARIALERSERPEIRQMADAIITSQEGEIEQMRAWMLEWYGTDELPSMSEMPSMHPMEGHGSAGHAMDMQAEVDLLRAAPEPFDLAFIDAMIPHHQSAIDAAEELLLNTQRPELRAMAQAIIAEQQREIAQMQEWRTAWYPDTP